MATNLHPLRALTRTTPHTLRPRASLPRQPIHPFTTTSHRPLRSRGNRPEKDRTFRAAVDHADSEFSFPQSSYEYQTSPGHQAAVPREYGPLESEPQVFGRPDFNGFFEERGRDHDDDYEADMDDISATAHGELEQVRELRELERASGWDAPMLFEHAQEFRKPGKDRPLRFRYTTYLGETHPGSRKVVMEFKPRFLPNLTTVQADKLIKLLGARYDPDTKWAKMSSEKEATAPQNKNFLVATLEGLLKECREGADTFEDVPFDFRHVRHRKPKVRFPREWLLNGERKRYLEDTWARNRKQDEQREVENRMVDGKMLMGVPLEAMSSEEPEMVVARRRPSG